MTYALDLASAAFGPLDRHFATAVMRRAQRSSPAVESAAALASRQVRHGHVCVDFRTLDSLVAGDETVPLPWSTGELDRLFRSLEASDAVRAPGDSAAAPLVLDGTRLYLERYYAHEVHLAESIRSRLRGDLVVDESRLEDGLRRFFPSDGARDQRTAADRTVRKRFAVITGGPGTGKTSTVVKILALLLEQAGEERFAIDLLAPTGKAAQRLLDAVERAKLDLPCTPETKARIPSESSTIHRRLKLLRGRVQHHRDHPLSTDLVVVDEASMVDMIWMSRLVDAVPEGARILLLGDKDQLASVEAGTVLADICGAGLKDNPNTAPLPPGRAKKRGVAKPASRNQLSLGFDETPPPSPAPPRPGQATAPIARCVAELTKSYRYKPDSGIAALAAAIKAGRVDEVTTLVSQGLTDVVRIERTDLEGGGSLLSLCLERYAGLWNEPDPNRQLKTLDRFRVLCAHRRGQASVEFVNRSIERALVENGRMPQLSSRHYPGRPVLVTKNDYELGLFNGDAGMIVEIEGELRAAFPTATGDIRYIYPARLESVETLFAMSIHKSQGSEMDEVAVVLPPKPSPLVTRELLYTAVTRARTRVYLSATNEAIQAAVTRRVERASGLGERLWCT